METEFFKYLFSFLRGKSIAVHYSLPANVTYPACECSLAESQSYQDKYLVTFTVKIFADTTAHSKLQTYASSLTQLLEGSSHTFDLKSGRTLIASLKLLEQVAHPAEKGALRTLTQTYQAFVH